MPRVKRGVAASHRHKKVLQLTKGHRGGRHNLIKQARESMLKALHYAFRHRRERKGDMRRLWITRINAAARLNGISYSQLINGLNEGNVNVDRKIMADMAVRDPEGFEKLANIAKEHLSLAPV